MSHTRPIVFFLVVVLALALAFLALRASPYLTEVSWVPRDVADWADRNGNFRNFPAFGLLALAMTCVMSLRSAGVSAGGLAVIVEVAQIGIAGRTFDFEDIFWSLGGIASAVIIAAFGHAIKLGRRRRGDHHRAAGEPHSNKNFD